MEFRLLGPLEVTDGTAPLPTPPKKQRALLALLLLNANRTLARDRIVDDLWGEDVPESAQKMVQIHVSQLRKALPEPRLRTRAPGYVLEVAEDELDLTRFERLLAEGRRALSEGETAKAAEVLREALALWRGPALTEFSEPFAAQEARRLEELRLVALEWRIEADLAAGRHDDVVGELESLIASHPLRERLRAHHMLALYRSGRQAEALASYRAYRRTLDEELGIAPTSRLKALEERMLGQDLELDPASARTGVPAAQPARGPASARAEVPTAPPARTVPPAAPGFDVHYARSDVRIAYQVLGDGPLDLVLVNGWVCTFQPGWENPRIAAFYRRLASLGRLILFDKRGTGLSDRVSPEHLPDLETRMDDVRAVLDAVGSRRAIVLGISEGGPMSTLFAATHPERTLALVLMGTFAKLMHARDYPIGLAEGDFRRRLAALEADDWAAATTEEWLARVAPDLARDPGAVRWYVSYVLRGASPGANRAIRLMNAEIDVRDVLPTISVPTLVLYRSREYFREGTRFLGEHIPGARVVELPGNDHLPWEGDSDALLDEIERFVAGVRKDVEPDRVLATLLIADVGGASGGQEHHRAVRAQLARFRGQEVEVAGERVFATFDGPARAVRCATAIADALEQFGLDVRAGVHTGEVEQASDGARGVAVQIAARIAAAARPGEVLASSTVKDLVVGSGIAFEPRGEHDLDGVPGPWRLFAVRS